MTWEEKLAALQSLTETSLRMRKPGDWYVDAYGLREIGGNGILDSAYGNGKTPQEAVENDWLKMTSLASDLYIRVKGKNYRWMGYMWRQVPA